MKPTFDKIRMCDYLNFYKKQNLELPCLKKKKWNIALLIENK